jgi:LPXTG-motif cell wall-anchored protein
MIAVPVEGYNFAAPTTSSSTSSISSTGSASSSPSSSSPASSSGLSTGSKAGIGAGIAALVVVLAALGAFWFFRRRKYQAAPTSDSPGYAQNNGGVAPIFGGAVNNYKVAPVEAEANPLRQRWEMGSESLRPVEMQG